MKNKTKLIELLTNDDINTIKTNLENNDIEYLFEILTKRLPLVDWSLEELKSEAIERNLL